MASESEKRAEDRQGMSYQQRQKESMTSTSKHHPRTEMRVTRWRGRGVNGWLGAATSVCLPRCPLPRPGSGIMPSTSAHGGGLLTSLSSIAARTELPYSFMQQRVREGVTRLQLSGN